MRLNTLTASLVIGVAASATTALLLSTPERAAHATGEAVAPTDIAVFDLYGVLEQVLSTDEMQAAREDAVSPMTQQLDQSQVRLNELASQIQTQGVESPESQPLIQEFQTLRQSIQQLQAETNNQLSDFYATQMLAEHTRIVEAANTVAEAGGYGIVLSTRPPSVDLTAGPVDVMVQELLARPVVRAPASVDITAQVREQLGLPEPEAAAVDATPVAPVPVDAPAEPSDG